MHGPCDSIQDAVVLPGLVAVAALWINSGCSSSRRATAAAARLRRICLCLPMPECVVQPGAQNCDMGVVSLIFEIWPPVLSKIHMGQAPPKLDRGRGSVMHERVHDRTVYVV